MRYSDTGFFFMHDLTREDLIKALKPFLRVTDNATVGCEGNLRHRVSKRYEKETIVESSGTAHITNAVHGENRYRS